MTPDVWIASRVMNSYTSSSHAGLQQLVTTVVTAGLHAHYENPRVGKIAFSALGATEEPTRSLPAVKFIQLFCC